MYVQDTIARITAKLRLGLPLTAKDHALQTLYGDAGISETSGEGITRELPRRQINNKE